MSRVAIFVAGIGVLAAGCGGGSGGGDGDVLDKTEEVRLLDVQAQVFSPRCALSGCHIGPLAPHGLDLSAGASAGNLIGVASAERPALLRVEPFNAADSYLYMKVSGDPEILGDRMPALGDPLSAADLALIESWIEQGAL